MSTLPRITILIAILFFTSCSRKYELSNNDFKWMPYRGDETLVFRSNNGETDTIFLFKKDTLTLYPEAQNLFGTTYETVAIFCKHSDSYAPSGDQRYLENTFVELHKSTDRKARLHFGLKAKDANLYMISGHRIDSLANQRPILFQTADEKYNDVYVMEGEDQLDFKQRSNFVARFYWSKSKGLVRYDKQDGVYWELTNKYSR